MAVPTLPRATGLRRSPAALENTTFDAVVIGGGITGACIAHDAALRGLSVALIEQGDFGGATSAASSKLLHGGIRHLQQLRVDKVRESARERSHFRRIAPHLSRWVPFLVPTDRTFRRGRWFLGCGMELYALLGGADELSGASGPPSGTWLDRAELGRVAAGTPRRREQPVHVASRLRLGLSPRCPVLPHPVSNRLALFLRHRARPLGDNLERLLLAPPGGRGIRPFDRLDRTLYRDDLSPERFLLILQRVQNSAFRHRDPASLKATRYTTAPVPDPYAHPRPPPAAALSVRRVCVAAGAQLWIPSQPRPPPAGTSTAAARIWASVHTGHSRPSGKRATPACRPPGNRGDRRFG